MWNLLVWTYHNQRVHLAGDNFHPSAGTGSIMAAVQNVAELGCATDGSRGSSFAVHSDAVEVDMVLRKLTGHPLVIDAAKIAEPYDWQYGALEVDFAPQSPPVGLATRALAKWETQQDRLYHQALEAASQRVYGQFFQAVEMLAQRFQVNRSLLAKWWVTGIGLDRCPWAAREAVEKVASG